MTAVPPAIDAERETVLFEALEYARDCILNHHDNEAARKCAILIIGEAKARAHAAKATAESEAQP